MTLEELQVLVASHERQLELIRDSLRMQGELLRMQSEQHNHEMKELRAIVGEIGVMLKNFIASMQGGMKNGTPHSTDG